MHSGRVPSFRIKPRYGLLITAAVVLLFGVLGYYQALSDPGKTAMEQRGLLMLAVCIIVAGVLVIMGTARLWFRHLWHQRYK